jgi:uncharacterized OB-fold protein
MIYFKGKPKGYTNKQLKWFIKSLKEIIIFILKCQKGKPGIVLHDYNPTTKNTQSEWMQIQGQPGLYCCFKTTKIRTFVHATMFPTQHNN